MSQHPSLRSSEKDKKQRSVLKRFERLKILKDKSKWKEEDSVFGLPKIKVTRFKIKKEKAAATAEGAEGAVPAAGTPAEAAAKQTAATKPGSPAKQSAPAKGASR